uniref:Major sperm protein n=1 Tax=Panagrellus redivivus TaxID=6233 RepID=A0A7E4ZYT4_PANRE
MGFADGFQVSTKDIYFQPPLTNDQFKTIFLKNTSSSKICWKIQTTKPILYRTQPSQGFIKPGQTTKLIIHRLATFETVEAEIHNGEHQFRILYAFAKEHQEIRIETFWGIFAPENARSHHLLVHLEPLILRDKISQGIRVTQCDDNEQGDFDATGFNFVNGSRCHKWNLQCFPADDFAGNNGYISARLQLTTTMRAPITVSGVVQIDGTTVEEFFEVTLTEEGSISFPKLISHKKAKEDFQDSINVSCKATFTVPDTD